MKRCMIFLMLLCAIITTGCTRPALSPQPTPTTNPNRKAGDYAQSLSFGGYERTYNVHLPSAINHTPALPLVIVLHGGGGTGAGMQSLTRGGMNALADREGFVVVYPDGIEKQWNDGRKLDQARAMRENIDDVGFLAALIDHLAQTMNIDRRRVYATGISNGGMMSQRLACDLGDKIAAIGVVAASLSEDLSVLCKPTKPVSVLLIPGTHDPLVPWQGGEIGFANNRRGKTLSVSDTVAFWTTRNNCPTSPVVALEPDMDPKDGTRVRKETYAPCREASEVVLYAIEGGGHTWPNGRQYLPEQIVGKTSRDVDANTILWEFFKRHQMSAPMQTPAPRAPTLSAATSTPPPARPPALSVAAQTLLAQARAANPTRYQFALDQGARIAPTGDGKSFYVLWFPPYFQTTPHRAMIATLHGHASWAFDEFYLWQPYAAQRGYAILALQWWFGGGEKITDYYLPQAMYPIFESVFRQHNIQAGNVLLHGFSRGSANIYAITALDRDTRQNFFGLTIANAGMASPDFPPNLEITSGKFGNAAFAGTHWVMYCGEHDPNPNRDGCPAMRQTRDWVTKFGGTLYLLIEDKNGDHGGFHRNPVNVTAALDVFARLLDAK